MTVPSVVTTGVEHTSSARKFLSMSEAAERYGVHYKLINALVNDGTLPCIRLSRNAVRIPLEALERWEQAQMFREAK